MPQKRVLYLGYDGAYVLSKLPLVLKDDGNGPFLSYESDKNYQLTDLGVEGRVVFGDLKLKKYQVVRLEITESKPKRARKVP